MAKLNKIINEYVSSVMTQVNRDIEISIRETNDELCKEFIDMYNFYIKDFYSFKPKRYDRHLELRYGFLEGVNIKKGKHKPSLTIYIPGDYDYKSKMQQDIHKFDSSDDILNYVLSGYRFKHEFRSRENGNLHMIEDTWIPKKYVGTYFYYSGKKPIDAFYKLDKNLDDIAERLIRYKLQKRGYY